MARIVTVHMLVSEDSETEVTDLLNEQLRAFQDGDEPFIIDYGFENNVPAPDRLNEVINDLEYEEGMFLSDEYWPWPREAESADSLEAALALLESYSKLEICEARDLPEPSRAIDVIAERVHIGLIPPGSAVANLIKIARLGKELEEGNYDHITEPVHFDVTVLTDDAINYVVSRICGVEMHYDGERYVVSSGGDDDSVPDVSRSDMLAKALAARRGMKTFRCGQSWAATFGGKDPVVLHRNLGRAVAEAFVLAHHEREVDVPYVLMHDYIIKPQDPVNTNSPRM